MKQLLLQPETFTVGTTFTNILFLWVLVLSLILPVLVEAPAVKTIDTTGMLEEF